MARALELGWKKLVFRSQESVALARVRVGSILFFEIFDVSNSWVTGASKQEQNWPTTKCFTFELVSIKKSELLLIDKVFIEPENDDENVEVFVEGVPVSVVGHVGMPLLVEVRERVSRHALVLGRIRVFVQARVVVFVVESIPPQNPYFSGLQDALTSLRRSPILRTRSRRRRRFRKCSWTCCPRLWMCRTKSRLIPFSLFSYVWPCHYSLTHLPSYSS